MESKTPTGAQIRQAFIDFFEEHGHTFVSSASLVPGGDQTLLFTNAGMVQFKDVFLGTDKRPYKRATDSQKCMRVAGKHNDLEDVGRDNIHHTFFEMLGNWSFGDYYKKEAIAWAWQLLTDVWGLPKDNIWTTVFRDDKGDIPQDDEAADAWHRQPGINPEHVLFFGRKDNFWEMAEIGPCGPCSEIHLDRGIKYCDRQAIPGHVCKVNGDCQRYLELWNLVFIQYNRLSPTKLEPLPAKHVDTGMGFDRIVSVLQEVDSNYRTDMFWPMILTTQRLTGHTDEQREEYFTPYRVIADHARAAAFLIADGVVPGNLGRNYVTRMIIRRAYRFGGKIGLCEPFLSKVSDVVINTYGDFYPELKRNRKSILISITREEEQFQRTLDRATTQLEYLLVEAVKSAKNSLTGAQAADLYTTFGMPLEITRDIAREHNLDVDEAGFNSSMDEHRLASGAGKAMGDLGGEDVAVYRQVVEELEHKGSLSMNGVGYDPYSRLEVSGKVLAFFRAGVSIQDAEHGNEIETILPETCFYIESGGQVSDTGWIRSADGSWEIEVQGMRKPAAGVIVHVGKTVKGHPKVGDEAIATVDAQRRRDIMRNHTATHLLHSELRRVLGEHARQAGSLVAPDRLRFDFTHPEAVTQSQLAEIEAGVNQHILGDIPLKITYKPLQQAISEGAMALFGEKYTDTVRTITISGDKSFSYELCGGTHVGETGDIGVCLITSEGSVAAGIRRIDAVTGRKAYELIQNRFNTIDLAAKLLSATPESIGEKLTSLLDELSSSQKQAAALRQSLVSAEFSQKVQQTRLVDDVRVLTAKLNEADADTLRQMVDRFRQQYPSKAIAVLGSIRDGRPTIIAAITEDLVTHGLNAIELVRFVAAPLGGGGGGKPTLAQAGGKDASKLNIALEGVEAWVKQHYHA
ncbi:MAG: alanine--tRNA ligase [Chloroflexi bacterium RBG_16_47_49]|nr:MAG: alanine--tRNA ligase [Chloroflexi bacterium RBG_16_47_49]